MYFMPIPFWKDLLSISDSSCNPKKKGITLCPPYIGPYDGSTIYGFPIPFRIVYQNGKQEIFSKAIFYDGTIYFLIGYIIQRSRDHKKEKNKNRETH